MELASHQLQQYTDGLMTQPIFAGKTFAAMDIPSEPNSPPTTPKSGRKNKSKSPLLIDSIKGFSHHDERASGMSPKTKRFFMIRKQTQSESSLLDWITPSSCCRIQSGQRPSDAEFTVESSHVSHSHAQSAAVSHVDCFTLTPLYINEQNESFEVRRSAPRRNSPLPWATSQEPDYPNWIRSELRRSYKTKRSGTSATNQGLGLFMSQLLILRVDFWVVSRLNGTVAR